MKKFYDLWLQEKCESFLRQITEIFDNGHSDLSESDLNNLWILRLDLTTYVSGYKWARLPQKIIVYCLTHVLYNTNNFLQYENDTV